MYRIPFILHHPRTVFTSLWPQLFIIFNSWKWHPDIPSYPPLSGHFLPFCDVVLPWTAASIGPPTNPLEIGAVREPVRHECMKRKVLVGWDKPLALKERCTCTCYRGCRQYRCHQVAIASSTQTQMETTFRGTDSAGGLGGYFLWSMHSWTVLKGEWHKNPGRIRVPKQLQGTQDWEFFWLRFWILCYFIVSYAQILRFCKKTFFGQATIGEIQLFRLVWD
jgi:hypothetical protein